MVVAVVAVVEAVEAVEVRAAAVLVVVVEVRAPAALAVVAVVCRAQILVPKALHPVLRYLHPVQKFPSKVLRGGPVLFNLMGTALSKHRSSLRDNSSLDGQ